jgi:hypothetical protein
MEELIQSAGEAATQIDKKKELALIKQALDSNPKDIDALLRLASLVDEPKQKRQALNRILSVDASNKVAREILLEMDRAEMSAYRSKTGVAPAATESPSASPTSQPLTSKPANDAPTSVKKALVFKYPVFWRILVYVFLAIFGCMSLLAFQDAKAILVPCGLFLLLIPVVWIVSPVVEVNDSGIQIHRLFGTAKGQIAWNDITSMNAHPGEGMELSDAKGNVVKVTSQVSRYPAIVEILRSKRPDLFSLTPANVTPVSSQVDDASTSTVATAFTGAKTFQKKFFALYGVFLLMVPLCMVAFWFLIARKDYLVGIAIGLIALFFMAASLLSVSAVRVETNKLSTESLFGEKEYTAQQIKNISMKTVRSRRGYASNYVHIEPVEGNAFDLSGFPEGDEMMYGFLMNWWNTYQNK